MDLDYWQGIQNDQIGDLLIATAFLLLAIAYFEIALRYFRSNKKSRFDEWFGRNLTAVANRKAGHLIGSICFTLIWIVCSAVLVVSVISLQIDIKQELPADQTIGTVATKFALTSGSIYVFIEDGKYAFIDDSPNLLLERGKKYQITYLQHSREIISAKEISD